ncbi:zinc finger protein 43-like [Planococcus citri]|uniref:zinc finger protein 43-like n=1 Tax=Planococcus citri TaxID=170843 RepID=UPI0031F987EF
MHNEHCRLCGNQNNEKLDIFSEICSNKKLESKIREIVRLNILPEDPLPKTVCVSCINHLENASHFVDQCHQTQAYLSQLYEESILPIPTQNSFRAPNYAEKITVVLNDRADIEINITELRSILTHKIESNQTNSDNDAIGNNSSQIISVPLGDNVNNTHQNSIEVRENSSSVQDNSDPLASNHNYNSNTNTPDKKNIILVDKISDENSNDIPSKDACSSASNSQEPIRNANGENTRSNRSRLKRKCTMRVTPVNNHLDFSDEENREPDDNSDNGDDLTDKNTKKPKLQSELGLFSCKLCRSPFKALQMLNQHIKTVHTIGKDHLILKKHNMRNSHSKPYVCAICDWRTGEKKLIRRHIASKHSSTSWTSETSAKENDTNEQTANGTSAFCGQTFSKELHQEHSNVHSRISTFSCKLCTSSFKKKYNLNRHIQRVHSEKQFSSTSDHIVKHKDALTQHKKIVHETSFACDMCDYKTSSKGHIQQHIADKHTTASWTSKRNAEETDTNKQKSDGTSALRAQTFPPELYQEHLNVHSRISSFSCNLCTSEFKKKYNLYRHLQTVHSVKKFSSTSDYIVKHKDELTQHKKVVHETSFACDMCDYKTSSKGQIQQHIADKHTVASWTSKRNAEENDQKHFFCATCDKTFSQELTYQEHLNVHSGKRPFSCKLCTASFRARQDLNQHLRTIHSEKQFKCPTCNYVAKHKGKLTEHIKCVHDKPFACDKCAYRTGEKGKIQQHIASKHTKALSFVCEVCGNGFKTRYSLQMHMKNIHFPEPKVCQTCGTICPSLSKYNAHVFRCGKEKQKYKCEKCGQTYVSKEILRDHMNKHLNLKPYKCKVCGKAFHMRTRLWTHEYVHRGANYQCEICNRSFNRKDNMKNHMKRHFYKSMRCDDTIVTAV